MEFKDRDEKTNYLKLALALCHIPVSYGDASLIKTLFDEVERLGGDFTLKDAADIQINHEKKMDEYYKSKETKQ